MHTINREVPIGHVGKDRVRDEGFAAYRIISGSGTR